MYGLMQAHLCSRPTQEPQTHRLHYCGTCKTMGRLYGQKARFLLNHDAVFLAELLTALAPQSPPVTEWSGAYQSYNCFTLPHGDADMPLSLQIARRRYPLDDRVQSLRSDYRWQRDMEDGAQNVRGGISARQRAIASVGLSGRNALGVGACAGHAGKRKRVNGAGRNPLWKCWTDLPNRRPL